MTLRCVSPVRQKDEPLARLSQIRNFYKPTK